VNEILAIAYSYARAAWRRRKLAMAVAWAVAVLGWAVVLVLPDRYEASARVFVDARTALKPMLEGIAIEEDYDSQISLVREALLSRPQLEAVVLKTHLDAGTGSGGDMDGLVTRLQEQIQVTAVSPLSGGNPYEQRSKDMIYTIAYENVDREKSVEVVATLLQNFEQGTLNGNRTGASEAQGFLNQQIAELESRLQEAEERLAEFKKRNIGLTPGERGDYFTRLDQEMKGLQDAETQLAVAYSRRAELQRQLAAARAYLPGTAAANASQGSPGATPDITIRRQEAQQRLEDLLLRYTPRHPEVVALTQTIADLKEREAKEIAELQRGGAGSGEIRSLSVNPIHQQIQTQLGQVQVEIASFQGAASQHRGEIANLRKYVDQAPEIEQEFARLNRDYGVTKEQYDQLVQRREQARVTDDAARVGVIRFDVIEPPRAAPQPVWPVRPLLFFGVLLGALAAGLATALLPQLLAPTFDDTKSVERSLGLAVIGSVSAIRDSTYQALSAVQRRQAIVAVGSLVALGLLLVVLGNHGSRLLRGLIS
jgi:polysaccharide chain length determinant protein (PEP-CTERM system associated)